MTDTRTVYVVDDDEPVRDAIGMLLDSVDIAHVAFDSATAFLEQHTADQGGVLVLDIRMPGMSGLDLQRALAEQDSPLPIIFITGHGDVPMAVEAMRRGAVDFLRKPFRDQELLDCINEALSVADNRLEQATAAAQVRERVATLTPREQQVFGRVAAGQANKVIAIELEISERTVEIHRSAVMKKTGARSLADLVRLSLALEDLDSEPS
ncbi:MAG: response regulator transcription factor [Pseudomonadota bacterium]